MIFTENLILYDKKVYSCKTEELGNFIRNFVTQYLTYGPAT